MYFECLKNSTKAVAESALKQLSWRCVAATVSKQVASYTLKRPFLPNADVMFIVLGRLLPYIDEPDGSNIHEILADKTHALRLYIFIVPRKSSTAFDTR